MFQIYQFAGLFGIEYVDHEKESIETVYVAGVFQKKDCLTFVEKANGIQKLVPEAHWRDIRSFLSSYN